LKTGSSYLQSVFRSNRDILLENYGIHYPTRGDDPGKDPVTGVGAGNAKDLFATTESFRDAYGLLRPAKPAHLLLSSEALYQELGRHRSLGFVAETARALGYDRVRILLFIRDPVACAASFWQQDVKLGATEPIEQAFETFGLPEAIDRLLAGLQGVEDVEVTVRNYSRCSDRLLEAATAWLGLPEAALRPLPVAKINRSFTASELALKLALNRVIGPRCTFFTKAIVERLPELEGDEIRPAREVQQRLLDRLQPAMERVNARLPASERYRADLGEATMLPDRFVFSAAQITAIAESLGGEINRLRARPEPSGFRRAARAVAPRALVLALKRLRGRAELRS
jgi:hypothetical protein